MKTVFRVVALFGAYSAIGFGGDYAVGLLARDAAVAPQVVSEPDVRVDARVVVDVEPTIVSRVRVRSSQACTFETVRETSMPAGGISQVNIQAGAGALHVEGQAGLDEIVVVGLLCASQESYLDGLQIATERLGDGAMGIETQSPDRDGLGHGNETARIDLTVLVPLGMSVDIEDSSGDMDVIATGDLRIDDSSGSIAVSEIVGSVRIDDSSGGLEVRGVSGDVAVEDGSGGIEIHDVAGSVTLRDGSGGIELSEIERSVLVEADGSGGIDVRGVGGDLTVERDGSGGIRYIDVVGNVDVPARERRPRRGGR